MIDCKKFTAPIPSGNNTLAAYGNVTTGKTIPVTVFKKLRTIFVFKDVILNLIGKLECVKAYIIIIKSHYLEPHPLL